MTAFKLILPGHPATKKNSPMIIRKHAVLLPSKTYLQYEKECRRYMAVMKARKELPHYSFPVNLQCHYWLESKSHWPDLTGLEDATADIISDEYKVIDHHKTLTASWVLSNDVIIRSWDGSHIAGIDARNPRVEITITPLPVDPMQECNPYIIRQMRERMKESLF